MKVWQLLEIESVLSKRAIPSDLIDDNTEYYSESDQAKIKIKDMEILHLIRAFKKQVNTSIRNPEALKQFFELAYEITNKRSKQ